MRLPTNAATWQLYCCQTRQNLQTAATGTLTTGASRAAPAISQALQTRLPPARTSAPQKTRTYGPQLTDMTAMSDRASPSWCLQMCHLVQVGVGQWSIWSCICQTHQPCQTEAFRIFICAIWRRWVSVSGLQSCVSVSSVGHVTFVRHIVPVRHTSLSDISENMFSS